MSGERCQVDKRAEREAIFIHSALAKRPRIWFLGAGEAGQSGLLCGGFKSKVVGFSGSTTERIEIIQRVPLCHLLHI